jgi:hypothetical protein
VGGGGREQVFFCIFLFFQGSWVYVGLAKEAVFLLEYTRNCHRESKGERGGRGKVFFCISYLPGCWIYVDLAKEAVFRL